VRNLQPSFDALPWKQSRNQTMQGGGVIGAYVSWNS